MGSRRRLHGLNISFPIYWLCDLRQLTLSMSQIPHLRNGHTNTTNLIGLLWGSNEICLKSLVHKIQQVSSMMLMLLKSPLGICFPRLNIPIFFLIQQFPIALGPSSAWAPVTGILSRSPAPMFLFHCTPRLEPMSLCSSGPQRLALSCLGICSFTDSVTSDFKHLYFYKWILRENWLF